VDGVSIPHRPFGYPEDYQDPEWDGTAAQFRGIVLPARVRALGQSLNETFADLLPPAARFEWTAGDG
jgi:hypothetical protein